MIRILCGVRSVYETTTKRPQFRLANAQESQFACGMIGVGNCQLERIAEDGLCFLESHAVVGFIGSRRFGIPFKLCHVSLLYCHVN